VTNIIITKDLSKPYMVNADMNIMEDYEKYLIKPLQRKARGSIKFSIIAL
jgi:hypothetical protein